MKPFLFALLTALLWGSAPIFEKLGLVKINPLIAISIRSFAISIILMITLSVSSQFSTLARSNWQSAVLIIIGGIFAGLLGQWTYFKALKLGQASKIVPLAATYPLFTALFALAFLGETFSLAKGLGIAFIITGIALIM